MDPVDLKRNLMNLKPIIEEKFLWFAYHKNEPIGFTVMIPDVNQIIKYMNGKNNWWAKLKFAWHKYRKTINRARIIIMGVVPKFQKMGIDAAMIISVGKIILAMKQYKEVELSWVGDFNPKMRALHESTGATLAKRHFTYRKLFKSSSSLKRSKIIAKDTKEQAAKQASGKNDT